MRSWIVAGLLLAEALVFCAIVACLLQLSTAMAQGRTMHCVAHEIQTAARDLAFHLRVGRHHRSG